MNENHPLQKVKNLVHLGQSVWANVKFSFPYKKLKIIGVTGTDGKTTTTSMIYHILLKNKLPVGYISTISAKIGDKELDTGLHVTTPDPWEVPRYLQMMVAAKITYVVLESTSSGLQQNRLWGIKFDAATITNIKSDHLDYHVTWENYANAKFKLIKQLKPTGLGVLNHDDENARNWLTKKLKKENLPSQIIWYSQYDVKDLEQSITGMSFVYKGQQFKLPVIGGYNLENALAAINVTSKYLPLEKIAQALQTFSPPKGRMEVMQKKPFIVIIDFAHTAHALEVALKAVKIIQQPNSKIITVFGCAGKRDKARREMGKISAEFADITVLTAEDPRNEKLADVNDEIINQGALAAGKLVQRFADHDDFIKNLDYKNLQKTLEQTFDQKLKPFFAFDEDNVNSRSDAIALALKLAEPNDIVFITGKAHEQSLAFGQTEYPWSDHETVKAILKKLKH